MFCVVMEPPTKVPRTAGPVTLRRADSTIEGYASIVSELEVLFTAPLHSDRLKQLTPASGWIPLEALTVPEFARLHTVSGGGSRAAAALRASPSAVLELDGYGRRVRRLPLEMQLHNHIEWRLAPAQWARDLPLQLAAEAHGGYAPFSTLLSSVAALAIFAAHGVQDDTAERLCLATGMLSACSRSLSSRSRRRSSASRISAPRPSRELGAWIRHVLLRAARSAPALPAVVRSSGLLEISPDGLGTRSAGLPHRMRVAVEHLLGDGATQELHEHACSSVGGYFPLATLLTIAGLADMLLPGTPSTALAAALRPSILLELSDDEHARGAGLDPCIPVPLDRLGQMPCTPSCARLRSRQPPMHACVHACVHVCMHVCMHACDESKHTRMHARAHTRAHTHTHTYARKHTHTHTRTHARTHACHMHAHAIRR